MDTDRWRDCRNGAVGAAPLVRARADARSQTRVGLRGRLLSRVSRFEQAIRGPWGGTKNAFSRTAGICNDVPKGNVRHRSKAGGCFMRFHTVSRRFVLANRHILRNEPNLALPRLSSRPGGTRNLPRAFRHLRALDFRIDFLLQLWPRARNRHVVFNDCVSGAAAHDRTGRRRLETLVRPPTY